MKPDEAIEILKNMKWSITTKFNAVNSSTKALDMAISALEKQEQDRWIPCKERPPEEDGRYLITEKTDGTKVQEGYFCRTRDGEPYWGYLHVIAWRPLPEAYTEEEK